MGAEFEEKGGAAGRVGVDCVDGEETGSAVEVGCVGDGEEGEAEVGVGGLLGEAGPVDGAVGGEGELGGEDVGGGVVEGVGEEWGVLDRDGWRWWLGVDPGPKIRTRGTRFCSGYGVGVVGWGQVVEGDVVG